MRGADTAYLDTSRAGTSGHGRHPRTARADGFIAAVTVAVSLLAGCGPDAQRTQTATATPPSVPAAETGTGTGLETGTEAGVATGEGATAGASAALSALEQTYGARLGLYAVDTATGRTLEHRPDERFAFASTAKAFAAAAVLDHTTDAELDSTIPVDPQDLVTYSPVTETYAGAAIPLEVAAEAAITVSDNTAMNLLLDQLGGPRGLQDALVEVGDTVTDPERYEPDLNDVVPGSDDPADTSTPRALATTLRAYAVDDALSPEDRDQLVSWLIDNTTGDALVRAGVPDGWLVGDKTGSPSGYGARNDIAVIWPNGDRSADPWVVAITTSKGLEDAEPDDELLAAATALIVDEFSEP